MKESKHIALVAHDSKKKDLLNWALKNREILTRHLLYSTGTTGFLLEEVLGLPIRKFKSGPLGGDQQIGARIANEEIDMAIFFWDPLQIQPHDSDVRAFLRIAALYNVPMACDRASADFMISSPLMDQPYDNHQNRRYDDVYQDERNRRLLEELAEERRNG